MAVAQDPAIARAELKKRFKLEVSDLRELFVSKKLDVLKELGGPKGLAKKLDSNSEKGLTTEEADAGFNDRALFYGRNQFPRPKSHFFFEFVWEAFKEAIIIILTAFAIASIIFSRFYPEKGHEGTFFVEGTAVIIAVLIVSFVGGGNNWNQERQFQKLNERTKDRPAKVIRDGKIISTFASQIQVGDLVALEQGDLIPADGIYVSGHSMSADESAMTGEPDAIKKNETKPWLISGTLVNEGNGLMLAIAVGLNSEWGILLAALQKGKGGDDDENESSGSDEDDEKEKKEEEEEKKESKDDDQTPMQRSLTALASLVGWIGTGIAVATFVVLCIRFGVDAANDANFTPDRLTELIPFAITCGALIVVAVPEGLPLAVTICLAYSMKAMVKDNNLVRHLSACETMGGATNICSDKTGTLTENRMNVTSMWIMRKLYSGSTEKPLEEILLKKVPEELIKLFVDSVCINSSNSFLKVEEKGTVKYNGNKTECSMLLLTRKLGFDYEERRKSATILHLFPFSSERKRMSVILQDPKDKRTFLHTKGASEIVLGMCTSYLTKNGTDTLTKQMQEDLKKVIEELASDGLRTLCIAYKELDEVKKEYSTAPETDLTLIAIVGIQDPLRQEVPEAIRKCKGAGIIVRMVTGDNKLTARRIAKDCGIYDESKGHLVMEGPDFRKLSDAELDPILPKLTVLARSSPTDKFRLVTRLKQLGEVVAVTGDGTNDGPALRAADVGLAMGIAGTDIAKEACDIIITDDNFASIVKTVMWGRSVRQNIQKFLQFQLTINFSALIITFIGVVSGYGQPLTSIQLLWVNLIQDSLAALALATEKPTEDLLNGKPCGRSERLINPAMWKFMLGSGLMELVVLFVLLYAGDRFLPLKDGLLSVEQKEASVNPSEHYTMIFNTFVWLQIFNEFNARKIDRDWNPFRGMFVKENWLTAVTILLTIALQIILVQLGGLALSCAPLDIFQWLICIAFGLVMLPFGLILRRFVPNPDFAWLRYTREARKNIRKAQSSAALVEDKQELP